MATGNNQPIDNLQHITDLLCRVTDRLSSMEQNQNTRFGAIEQHMGYVEQQVSQIGAIQLSMSHVEARVTDIGNELARVDKKVSECETSTGCMSDMCDEILQRREQTDNSIVEVNAKLEALNIDSLRQQNSALNDKLLDLQCKLMDDSLLFTGIRECDLRPGDNAENVEDTLSDFLKTEMDIQSDIPFEHVQRRGRYNPQHRYPRPIVGKFAKKSDRDTVKRAAPGRLVNKPQFGVRELFPQEIEQKRKLLFPVMKRLKQNRDNRVSMFRDRLFLNGREYFPTHADLNPPPTTGFGFPASRIERNRNIPSFDRNRPQTSGAYPSDNASRPAWTFPRRFDETHVTNAPPQTPTFNHFDALGRETNSVSATPAYTAPGKQKARSPLEGDQSSKKQRDDVPLTFAIQNDSDILAPGINIPDSSSQMPSTRDQQTDMQTENPSNPSTPKVNP